MLIGLECMQEFLDLLSFLCFDVCYEEICFDINNDLIELMTSYIFVELHQCVKVICQSKALIKLNSTVSSIN